MDNIPFGNSNRAEIRIVSEPIIREAFNAGKFWERARQREFIIEVRHDSHYSRRQARKRGHRYCSRSQVVRYLDDDRNLIAVVHQIRTPDGNLGASGKPDPKYLRLDDVALKVR